MSPAVAVLVPHVSKLVHSVSDSGRDILIDHTTTM